MRTDGEGGGCRGVYKVGRFLQGMRIPVSHPEPLAETPGALAR